MREGQCLAMDWFLARPYQIGKERVDCYEMIDWATRPEAQGSGSGTHLVKWMMQGPAPLLAIGGSEATRRILPKLNWKNIGEIEQYFLPLTGKMIGHYAARKTRLPDSLIRGVFRLAGRPWFLPRKQAAPLGGCVLTLSEPDPELELLYAEEKGIHMAPLPVIDYLKWLSNSPDSMGRYIHLSFRVGGRLRGWSFFRLCETPLGRAAYIIESTVATGEDYLWDWVLYETLAAAVSLESDGVYAGATHPLLKRSLRKFHFLQRPALPIYYWSNSIVPPPVLVFTNNTSDAALLPYPPA
jgi:hypothetical protein